MAIQNFLSGGFYGKLGDVVGQRWHNKRTIRTYVIPFNPRTDKQQANRQLFALATALAQQAYRINKGSPLWDTSQMGQFSIMVGLAKRRLQEGATPAEALPLFPDGHSVDTTLSSPSANWSAWPSSVSVSDTSYTFEASREMAVEIHCMDEHTGNAIFFEERIVIPQGSQFSYTFVQSLQYSLPSGSSIQAISTDDSQHNGSSIRLPPLQITQPSKPNVEFKILFQLPAVHIGSNEYELRFMSFPPLYPYDVEFVLYSYDRISSSWDDFYYFIPDEVEPPYYLDVSLWNDATFQTGTYIRAGQYLFESATASWRVFWDKLSFTVP